jgi:hypothetical protein
MEAKEDTDADQNYPPLSETPGETQQENVGLRRALYLSRDGP